MAKSYSKPTPFLLHRAGTAARSQSGGDRRDDVVVCASTICGAAAIGLRQGCYCRFRRRRRSPLVARSPKARPTGRVLAGGFEAGSSMADPQSHLRSAGFKCAHALHEGATRRSFPDRQRSRRASPARATPGIGAHASASRAASDRRRPEAGAQRSVGRDLVERGVFSGHDLYTAIRVQAEEISTRHRRRRTSPSPADARAPGRPEPRYAVALMEGGGASTDDTAGGSCPQLCSSADQTAPTIRGEEARCVLALDRRTAD